MFLDNKVDPMIINYNPEDFPYKKISLHDYMNSMNIECNAFNEGLALSEVAWNNITISAMNEEFSYFNEGIASKFLGNIKKFFSKMIDWIRGRYKDLKNFSNKTLIKMKKVFGLISTFATENEERILNGAKTKEVTVNILDWYPSLIKLKDLEVSLEKLQFSDEFESIINDTKKFVDDHFKSPNVVEVKVTSSLAKIAIENAKTSPSIEGLIKRYVLLAEESLRETEIAANEGNKTKDDENIIIKSRNAVEEGKKKILSASKKCSILINLANKAIIDSHRINVACASMYTGE